MEANKTYIIRVDKETFDGVEENRNGLPKTKFLKMYLVDGEKLVKKGKDD